MDFEDCVSEKNSVVILLDLGKHVVDACVTLSETAGRGVVDAAHGVELYEASRSGER